MSEPQDEPEEFAHLTHSFVTEVFERHNEQMAKIILEAERLAWNSALLAAQRVILKNFGHCETICELSAPEKRNPQ